MKVCQTLRRLAHAAFIAAVVLALGGAGLGEEQQPLLVSSNTTTVDGVVHEDEYSYSHDYGFLKLYANRSSDTLYLGVVAHTTGWVAVGLGSLKMDGATIFMGVIEPDGTVRLKPQTGTGHTHGDVYGDAPSTVVAYAMKEADGKTTLEIALRSAAYIRSGQSHLDLIFAMGQRKDLSERHVFRSSLRLKLRQ